MKKLLSGLLSLVMVFSLTPSTIAFADDNTNPTTKSEETTETPGSGDEKTTTGSGTGTESSDTTGENGGAETPSDDEETIGSGQEETTELPEGTGQLDLTNGKIVISPTGYTQGGTTYTYTGAYTITGSLICDTPLSFTNTSGDAVVYNVTLNDAHLLGDTHCSAVTFKKEETTSPITLNLTNNGTSEIRAWGGAAFQAFDNTTSIKINITDNGSLYLGPRDQNQGDTTHRIYDSNITCTVNNETVDNSGAYKSGTYETSSEDETVKDKITSSNATYTISEGGTYNVYEGEYTASEYAIVINTDEKVTLNIEGNVECQYGFVKIKSSGEVVIKGNKYKVYSGQYKYVLRVESGANPTITMKDGEFGSNTQSSYVVYGGSATNLMTLNNSTFTKKYNDETIVFANNLKVNNCTFKNGSNAIFAGSSITFGGTTTFTGTASSDVKLSKDATMSFGDNYNIDTSIKLSVSDYDSITSENPKRVIATSGVSKNMVEKITSTNDSYPVNYGVDVNGNGYLYLWEHTHKYTDIDKNNNSLIAKCSDSECKSSTVLATLNAKDVGYTGNEYEAEVEASDGFSILTVEYEYQKIREDGTYEYISSAPRKVGQYKVIANVICDYSAVPYELQKDFEITNTITPSETITIKDGGEYNVTGGTYNLGMNKAIVVDTADDVVLNIKGNLTINNNFESIYIKDGSGDVYVNAKKDDGTDYEINLGGMPGIYANSKKTVTFYGGAYRGTMNAAGADSSKLKFINCIFNGSQYSQYIDAKNIEINDCTFSGSWGEIKIFGGNAIFGGVNTFSDTSNDQDIYLYEGATITLSEGFITNDNYKLKVELYPSLGDDAQRQITTNTSEDMMAKITSTNQQYSTIYKNGDLYFWNHTHKWKYKTNGNVLSATCESEDCEYHTKPLTTTLIAEGGVYKNEAYYARIDSENEGNITFSEEDIKYYDKDNNELESAPVNAGTYKAEVDITYGETTTTLTKEFTISKADQKNTPIGVSSTDETIKGKKDGSITGLNSNMEYRKDGDKEYTSITSNSITGLAAGTYYVRYKEDANNNASKDLKIVIKAGVERINTVNLTINTPTGGKDLDETITSNTTGVKSVSLNWTDSGNNDKEGVAEYYPWAYTAHITVTPDTGYYVDENVEINVNGEGVGENKSINNGVLTFTWEYYSTKHQLTKVTAPTTPETFNNFYTQDSIIDSNTELVDTVDAVVDGENVQLDVTWSINYYDYQYGAKNTFKWSVNYDKNNYDVAESCVTSGETEIKNKKLIPVTITGKNSTITYDGSTIDVSNYFEISETSSDAAYTLSSGSSGKGNLNGVILTVEETGTFKIHVTTQEKGDYANASGDVTLTVEKGDIDCKAHGYSGTYDGKEHSINVSTDANVIYSTDGVNYSEMNPSFVNAGEYTVYYKVNSGINYNEVSDKKTVKISPNPVTVTAKSTSKTYGEEDPEFTYTIDGVDTLSDVNVSREKGNDVGTYDIKVSVDESTNPNYSITCKKGTLTIEPKDISDATVTLGKALVYSGSEQTQKVESVVVDGMDVTYSVSGNKATKAGSYTLTITGKGNFTGSVSATYTVVPTKAEQFKENADGKLEYGKGTISINTNGSGNLVTSKSELVEMLISNGSFTISELEDIYNGGNADITLKITDVSSELDDFVKSSMIVSGFTLGNQFLDISLYKGEEKIHTTSGKVKITIDVPDELINKDSSVKRTYYVIRNHNGEVSSIDGTFNEKNQTFTFETDKFSAYVLAYKDTTVKKSETEESQKTDTSKKTEQKIESKQSTKKSTNTSVQSNVGFYISLIMISMIGLVVLVKKKKLNN